MTTRAKLTLYSALATTLTTLCLIPLVHPSRWIGQAFLLIAVAAAAGAGLRRLALHRRLVPLGQLVIVAYAVLLANVGSSLAFGFLPGTNATRALDALLTSGRTDIQEYSIPAPASPGISLILAGSVGLIAVLVDTLAVTYRRAAAAGLPLLALYSVGTGLAGGDGSWFWFPAAATGYLLLLFAEGQDRLSRWGRIFHGSGTQGTPGPLSHSGHRIGLLALVCALVLPVFVPQGGLGLLAGDGDGSGPGNGRGTGLTSLNPVVALTANLNRQSDVQLFSYITDARTADQMYLRVASLDSFDGIQWNFSKTQNLRAVTNPLPRPQGLDSSVAATPVSTDVQISDQLVTEWLPVPYPAESVQVPGHWRFEPGSRALVGENGQKTTGLRYHVTSQDLQPTGEQLRLAAQPEADIVSQYTAMPANLPSVVAETAHQVTDGMVTPYDKAVALQNWFAHGPFQYKLQVDASTGSDGIVRFLQDKTGFCVHFAGTMAAMARTLGIPARVAIGFVPGKVLGTGKYIERSEDYHAWPELYFKGAGWLRFEPTPSRGTPPSYTEVKNVPAPAASSAEPSSGPSLQPSAGPSSSSSCAAMPHRISDCGDDRAVAVTQRHDSWWLGWPALTGFAVVLLLLCLLAAPMLWRSRLRRRRLGAGRHLPGAPELSEAQVLAAWEELIDSAWDLGIPPDDAATPRRTVAQLTEAGRLDATAEAAAGRVALATERVLYGRESGPQAPLGGDVRVVTEGLRSAAGRRERARATLLPASSARVRRRAADRIMSARERGHDRADVLRARLRRLVPARFRRD
ncbi:transglutaminase family protein [Kitasatospora sp. McL0602]|uniref:transglutaminase family protein n=1 Tax=Kitasatospora sp. McL0602 TaxID=3439530 RepID=UPI003F890EA7